MHQVTAPLKWYEAFTAGGTITISATVNSAGGTWYVESLRVYGVDTVTFGAGAQGAQGTIGTQGTIGAQGTVGAQGTTGSQGVVGSQGVPGSGVPLVFNSGTTSTSSSAGQFNFNNATVSSVTNVYINNASASSLGVTDQLWFSFGSAYAQFQVTSAPTLLSGVYTVPVTHQASGGTFSNGTTYSFTQSQGGAQGAAGAQGTVGAQGTIGSQGIQGTLGSQGAGATPLISAQTANYTISGTSDKNNLINITGLATQYIIVPASGFAAGDQVHVIKGTTTAQTTFIQGASGVTIQSVGTITARPTLRTQYSSATIQFITATQAYVIGDIA